MRIPPRLSTLAASIALAAPTAIGFGAMGFGAIPAAAAPATGHAVTPLYFTVNVGADRSGTCSIVADLYTPTGLAPGERVPAILTTHGFGGSKDSQAGVGAAFADRGYVVLAYSGLGFGGSGCPITLDDPAVDGVAASQLVDYLGGATGRAFTDAARTVPAPPLDLVRLDAPGDPRVGMVGGSYGGAIQFAAASVDARIDALAPMITWNDLSYSLAPNNTGQITPGGVSTTTPGAAKLFWALGFTGIGIASGVTNARVDAGRLFGCPNFSTFVCLGLVSAAATGTLHPDTERELRQRSVVSYINRVRVPTLLIQGQSDTLFNLNEAAATYRALQAQGTETKLIWANFGHSGPAAPGEYSESAPDPDSQYVWSRVADWFAAYLQDREVSTGPEFAYFRDWVSYSGIATPAYGTSDTFPVGSPTRYYLSGTSLTTRSTGLVPASQLFLATGLGLPTSVSTPDVLNRFVPLPEVDLPLASAAWVSPALTAPLDVVGSPTLNLRVQSPTPNLTLFVKVQDIGPDGSTRLVGDLVAPARVADPSKPFTVTLPAIVHRFAPGHHVRLVVSGGSINYRGGFLPTAVVIASGSSGQVLSLPTVR